MANIKSAKKRISTNDRQRAENRYIKATIATYIKNYRKALADGNLEDAKAQLTTTISYVDSACSKGVLHKNNASNKVAKLTAALDKASKIAPKKEEAKKTTVKKVEKVEVVEAKVEEAPVKKTAAKKTTAKKETAEKPAKKTATKKATKETK